MIAPGGGGGGSCLNRCCYHCVWIWLALSWCPWFIWRITRAEKSWEYESLAVNKFPLVWLFFFLCKYMYAVECQILGGETDLGHMFASVGLVFASWKQIEEENITNLFGKNHRLAVKRSHLIVNLYFITISFSRYSMNRKKVCLTIEVLFFPMGVDYQWLLNY